MLSKENGRPRAVAERSVEREGEEVLAGLGESLPVRKGRSGGGSRPVQGGRGSWAGWDRESAEAPTWGASQELRRKRVSVLKS